MLDLYEQEALRKVQDLEQQIVDRVSKDVAEGTAEDTPDKGVLFLSAIMHFEPDRWSIILNGQPIDQLGNCQGIWLKDVTPEQITFSLSDNDDMKFNLRVNQSFLMSENKIMVGDQRAH
jgi:hypothetical protein